MKSKKILWKTFLVLGIVPFFIALIYGVFSALNGFSGICFWMCENNYGFKAFIDSIFLYSYIFWPTYIIGIILIVIAIIKIKKK